MKYLKIFNSEEDYFSYLESESLILPNVSLISDFSGEIDDIKFNPVPEENNTHNGYEYVDLGLPSGLKWAKCNVGAEKESDYGLYFQWGDVVGYSSDQVGDGEGKKYFGWEDYKYCNGSSTTLTKYNSKSSDGIVDNKVSLELSDDAASVNMGGSWRMPSEEEYQELLNNTTNIWTTVNGVNGRLFTGNNGNTLFFPASGGCQGSAVFGGSQGYYWSSSLYFIGGLSHSAYCLCFYSTSNYRSTLYRYFGQAVRGVVD